MDPERVLAVVGDGQFGSGYVVGPRLVLSSAHVVGSAGAEVRVFRPGRAGVFGGVVLWSGTPGGGDDAALISIVDAGWVEMAGPVRWGRTVTFRPQLRCEAWGGPNIAQRDAAAAQVMQVSGALNPGDGLVEDRYSVSVDGPAPEAVDGGGSPWSPWGGLSGAALFCGDLLTGVVMSDPAGWSHGRLEAVPAYVLHQVPGFRAVLAEHGYRGVDLVEAVEWQEIAEAAQATDPGGMVRSPASLLRADRAVVPFRGRESFLDDLNAWAAGPGVSARLVFGPGGQGKTRLAREFGGRLAAERWAVLWLDPRADAERLRGLADAATPLLVVLDYAEARGEQLAAILAACARRRTTSPIRVLLLARTAGFWWDEARSASPVAEELLDGARAISLPLLEPGPEGQVAAYREAAAAFALVLASVDGEQGHAWSAMAVALPEPVVDVERPRSALALHMGALADLLDTAHAAAAPIAENTAGAHEVEDRLLRHERRYWRDTAEAFGLGPGVLSMATLTAAMAAATLIGPMAEPEADILLARVPGLADQTADRRALVRDWISALYPSASPDAIWDGLAPDRLAERFLGRHLAEHARFLDVFAPVTDPASTVRIVTVLTRAAAHPVFDHTLDQIVVDVCARNPRSLGPAAITVATQVEHPSPLLAALNRVVDDQTVPLDDLRRLADELPDSSHVLMDLAARLLARLVTEYRQATDDSEIFSLNLAGSLNEFSNRLGHLGRHEEGLAAITEAVTIRRQLAQEHPETYLPDLAASLNNLSNRLGRLGRHEEGLAAITEAVTIRRELAQEAPETYLPDLAMSLNNLSVHLGHLGQHEKGLAAITEAVTIRRELAQEAPETYLPSLATSLNNLSVRLGHLGRHEQGLATITEAGQIYRGLARTHPDTYLPSLAASLNNLSIRLGNLGRCEDALAAITEAVATRRKLAQAHPDAYLPDLAMSLNNLALILKNLGLHREAMATVTEAVKIYRELARVHPAAYQQDLENSLRGLAWLKENPEPGSDL